MWPKLFLSPKRDHVIEQTPYVRAKSEIYTPKRDDEHHHHFPGLTNPSFHVYFAGALVLWRWEGKMESAPVNILG